MTLDFPPNSLRHIFAAIWDSLYEQGQVSRCYDHRRYKAIWNRLNQLGWIHVTDARYWPTTAKIDGQAARWRMDEAIGRMIEADETGGEGRRRRTCYTQLIRPEPETLILVDPMRHNRYMRLRKPPDEPLRAA